MSGTNIVVIAGLAEIAAGSIAMGLGGYLAARTSREHYLNELEREKREIIEVPEREREEAADVLRGWGLQEQNVEQAVKEITADRKSMGDIHDETLNLDLKSPSPRELETVASAVCPVLPPRSPWRDSSKIRKLLRYTDPCAVND